ncbi:hypothetical protein ACXZ7B_00075 [Vibrio owensii]
MEAHWKVIEALANGTNPITGEALPSESLYNDPIVIRAMFAVLQDLKQSSKANKTKRTIEQRQRENESNGLPKNAGLPWTPEQRERLSEQFSSGTEITSLAEEHGRTRNAITAELKKQGLIEA